MNVKSQSQLLIVSFALLLSVLHLQAQPPGYRAAVDRAMSKVNMQQQMNHQMWMLSNRNYYKSETLSNPKYEFTVLLKDSTEQTVRSRIYTDTVAHTSYLVLENKALPKDAPNRQKKIFPSETLCVSRTDRSKGTFVQGFPTDSCWLFKVESGKISIYSFLSETLITTDYISALQVGDGPIEPLSEARLREILKGDEKALKALEKKNYYKAIQKFNGE